MAAPWVYTASTSVRSRSFNLAKQLRKACQSRLDAAQARIEKIVAGPDGKPAGTEPFDTGHAA